MRSLKAVGILMCVLALGSIAMAGPQNSMGIHEVSHVTFDVPTQVGTALLPAGDYVVRHTMEGQEHVMVFQRSHGKDQVKVKCSLVPLAQKARQTLTIYKETAENKRVLQELVFRGDTAKHVF